MEEKLEGVAAGIGEFHDAYLTPQRKKIEIKNIKEVYKADKKKLTADAKAAIASIKEREKSLKAGLKGEGQSEKKTKKKGAKYMSSEEKIYKTMSKCGALNIVIGIISIVGGIAAGVLLIVSGANLLVKKSDILF